MLHHITITYMSALISRSFHCYSGSSNASPEHFSMSIWSNHIVKNERSKGGRSKGISASHKRKSWHYGAQWAWPTLNIPTPERSLATKSSACTPLILKLAQKTVMPLAHLGGGFSDFCLYRAVQTAIQACSGGRNWLLKPASKSYSCLRYRFCWNIPMSCLWHLREMHAYSGPNAR